MSNLGEYKFTEFSTHKPTQDKFLQNVESGMSLGKIPLFGVGTTASDAAFPAPFPDGISVSPGFYSNDETVDSHKAKYPEYHDIIFPMMEAIANGVSLPPGPIVSPFQDPTVPLQKLIGMLSFDIEITPEIVDYIITNAQDFIDALTQLPDEFKPLHALMMEFPGVTIDEMQLKKDLKDLQEKINIEFPDFDLPPSLPIPTPPFIDLPDVAIPLMSIPGVGLINFILELINALISGIFGLIEQLAAAIAEFFTVVMEGIAAIIEFLFEKIFDIIEPVIEKFKNLIAQLGYVSTIGTILKYAIGMTIITIVAFLVGPGLIAGAVAMFLGLS